jgi:integrase
MAKPGTLLDISGFDQDPDVSRPEMAALAKLNKCNKNWRTLDNVRPVLHRLYQPLEAARTLIASNCGDDRVNEFCVSRLLLTVFKKRRSYWAWTLADWQDAMRKYTGSGHQTPLAMAYLLCGIEPQPIASVQFYRALCDKIFGRDAVAESAERVRAHIRSWGYTESSIEGPVTALHEVFLKAGSVCLEKIPYQAVVEVYERAESPSGRRNAVVLSRVLNAFGILPMCITPPSAQGHRRLEALMASHSVDEVAELHGIAAEWLRWAWRWYSTSTLLRRTRIGIYGRLRQAGRWLRAAHPEVTSPEQWDRKLAAEFVAAVDRFRVGEYHGDDYQPPKGEARPLSAKSKGNVLSVLRVFFSNCQEWGWLKVRLNPNVAFNIPATIRRSIGPNPRIIADEVWAKLLWAGLNLTLEDVPNRPTGEPANPIEFVKGVAAVWLFAGLRNNEICRLRRGCIRWDDVEVVIDGRVEKKRVSLLEVPVQKTGPAFVKPVDAVVGETIEAWEAIRPAQPKLLDRRTGELVDLLFAFRGIRLGPLYLNKRLIPLLCKKAGTPAEDARGAITSHRARSTIATQLYCAKQGMSLFELQEWLGHRCPSSTKHYLKLQPTKLARAFAEADYFRRNVRMVEVLIDADAVRSGRAVSGEPWKFYDLGHGYCTYDFFEQCPHRMACARCDYYMPKESSRFLIIEARGHLLRMRQEIPLTEAETAAVDDGIGAMDRLCAALVDVPTPSGQTPTVLRVVR